jgi:hypothetical protein
MKVVSGVDASPMTPLLESAQIKRFRYRACIAYIYTHTVKMGSQMHVFLYVVDIGRDDFLLEHAQIKRSILPIFRCAKKCINTDTHIHSYTGTRRVRC